MDYALITGASRGIGKALANELALRKINLLLTARTARELEQVSGELSKRHNVDVHCFSADLSLPDAPGAIAQWCSEKGFPLKVLVNNAGYGLWGMFENLSVEEQLNMMQLNMISLVHLTHLLLPMLKKNIGSHILNVSSIAAYQAIPAFSIYAASKSFVLSFSRGLRSELSGTAVNVSCLCPGPTETGFVNRARMDKLKPVTEFFNMNPNRVAQIAVRGMLNKNAEIIPGAFSKLSAISSWALPKNLTEFIAGKIYHT